MSADAHAPSEAPPAPEFSLAYRRYALGLLVVVYVVNFLDRQVLGILLDSIKADLGASDTALGFLSGFAFAALYSTLGVPIAAWADRGTRRNIIALALFAWSAMTALQGRATSFAMLALARVGVGIGEAGCSPPAHSLISDLYPARERATALAVYSLGIPIGGGIGFLAGGWLDQLFGWRLAFVVVGLPGVVLALVVRATLREPTRGYWEGAQTAPRAPALASFKEVVAHLARCRSFVHLAIAAALHAFYGYGSTAFNASFYRRSHVFELGELGSWLAVVLVVGGGIGTWLGGTLTDRLGARDARYYVWVPGLATLLGIPFVLFLYTTTDQYASLRALVAATLFGSFYYGPTFALTQSLVPARLRAQAAAVLLFVINMIGLGFGPQFVGVLSDALAPDHGSDSLRLALLFTVAVGAAWATVHYALAARTLREDLAATMRA